jgi:PAS domain S-box-containing protein
VKPAGGGDELEFGPQAGNARLLFDALVELAVFHEVVYGPDGQAVDYRILDCNATFTRLTGIPREQAVGRLASEVYGCAPPYLEVYARVAATGEPARFDTYFQPMGRYFSISVVSPRRGCFATLATDVTERHLGEEALARSRAELQTILENVVEGVMVADLEGRLLYWNPAAMEMHGFRGKPLEESLQASSEVFELSTDEGVLPPAQWPLRRVLRGEHLADLQVRVRRKDGDWQRTFSFGGRLVKDSGGRGLMAVVTVRDVSEREQDRRHLASERQRLAVTLRSIGDAVIATDDGSRVTLLNEEAERLTGWTAAEAVGRPLEEVYRIVHERTRLPVPNPVHRALREGSLAALKNHSVLIAQDGSERPVADTSAPIREEDGRISGAVLVFRDQTKERLAELAVARSEARYRSLFENIAEEVTIYEVVRGEGGEIVDWIVRDQNRQARTQAGTLSGQPVGRRLTELLEGETARPLIERSRAVMSTGVPHAEDLFLASTGRHYHVSLFQLDASTLALARTDVTRWKEAEEALTSSEALYRTLFTLAPSGVFLNDERGRILAFNDRAAAQAGYTREEYAQLSVSDLNVDLTSRTIEERTARILSGVEQEFEARHRTKGGDIREVLISARAIQIGREKRVLAVVQDQTERKRAADALRESEELFRVAFQTSPDAINLNRLQDGVFVAVNDGFARILGWTEAEVQGRSSLDLEIWDDPADRARLVAELRAKGYAENLEAQFRSKDGRRLPGLMSARVIRARGEDLILSITRDISEWRRTEVERDLLQARLQEAAKMEAVGRLAGGVAHDFNNLLTVILGCSEAIESDLSAGRPASAEDAGEIHAAGVRARDLTRQLLTFARRQVIAPEPLDLGSAVRGCEKLLRRVLGKDVEMVVSAQPELWLARCDPGQMEQVLLNLAVNARDAMPDGGTFQIEVTNLHLENEGTAGRPGTGPGEYVRVRVKDSGTGMTAEVKEHIFEPFFTTKGTGKGNGLGLATVFGVVKQSGGFIRVESEVGRGTAFEICFPRTFDSPAVPQKSPRSATTRGTERILLVEDDPSVREVTSRVLSSGGYQVLVAGGSAEALELLAREERPLHLLVTDVVMPGLSGRDLAREVREKRPGLTVLFISGYAESALSKDGVLEAGVELLPKPFTPSDLLARVRALLDGP